MKSATHASLVKWFLGFILLLAGGSAYSSVFFDIEGEVAEVTATNGNALVSVGDPVFGIVELKDEAYAPVAKFNLLEGDLLDLLMSQLISSMAAMAVLPPHGSTAGGDSIAVRPLSRGGHHCGSRSGLNMFSGKA